MKQNMLNKKRGLKPGEIVSLKYDQAFKIMYGDENHIEILTMLLSKILEIDYNDLEGVLDNMNKDSDLVSGYYNWRDEQDKMNKSIINEVKRKSLKEGIEQGIEQGIQKNQREVVLNMYKDNLSIETISKYTNLSLEEVNKIINGSNMN